MYKTIKLRCMRCMRCMTKNFRTEGWGEGWGEGFGPWSSYLKMALKNEFFDFFQTVCFRKAETELEMDLLDFLGSEVI